MPSAPAAAVVRAGVVGSRTIEKVMVVVLLVAVLFVFPGITTTAGESESEGEGEVSAGNTSPSTCSSRSSDGHALAPLFLTRQVFTTSEPQGSAAPSGTVTSSMNTAWGTFDSFTGAP